MSEFNGHPDCKECNGDGHVMVKTVDIHGDLAWDIGVCHSCEILATCTDQD